MAIYQTEHEEFLKSEGFPKTKSTSDIFPDKKAIPENGDLEARNYELIEVFDPKNLGETIAPYILSAELQFPDAKELQDFYEQEHFPLLGKVPGYRRGLRYKLGPDTPLTIGKPAKFLALHEFDKSHGIEKTKEMEAVRNTPWTNKVMDTVKFSEIRTYELIKAFGY